VKYLRLNLIANYTGKKSRHSRYGIAMALTAAFMRRPKDADAFSAKRTGPHQLSSISSMINSAAAVGAGNRRPVAPYNGG
jgi:hypothetical protein